MKTSSGILRVFIETFSRLGLPSAFLKPFWNETPHCLSASRSKQTKRISDKTNSVLRIFGFAPLFSRSCVYLLGMEFVKVEDSISVSRLTFCYIDFSKKIGFASHLIVQFQFVYPPAKVGGWQKQRWSPLLAVPPKLV